ncbi:NIPSNAP family protein [Streptosporangium sp. NBC_01495]|uniref:NIPSNAP family protein n=1 Tax=Streptosporangium sp. NBC_01495 TaxID=2903899 RepID=UPI002E30DB3D|nr:NIPSNAP family protein [Streptosporangium sp. NBC_01495]
MTNDALHRQAEDICCPILELRRYTLYPGRREDLITLFDREFVESQEAEGMRVVGQFRDMDDPGRFVWLRGFRDMESRAGALAAFYGGPVWKAHRDEANGTMIDSDDVLLLRPAAPGAGFDLSGAVRPAADGEATARSATNGQTTAGSATYGETTTRPTTDGETATGSETATDGEATTPPATDDATTAWSVADDGPSPSLFTATICHPDIPGDEFAGFFDDRVAPLLAETGAAPLARLRTEHAENTYPALPVRTGEDVFVWFSAFAGQERYDEHAERLAHSARWVEDVLPELSARLASPPERLYLTPTARSLLR